MWFAPAQATQLSGQLGDVPAIVKPAVVTAFQHQPQTEQHAHHVHARAGSTAPIARHQGGRVLLHGRQRGMARGHSSWGFGLQ